MTVIVYLIHLESPLGNLFANALLAAVPGADVAIGMGARRGGLRADLPAGALTRGLLYDVFPFDNRVVTFIQQAFKRPLCFYASLDDTGVKRLADIIMSAEAQPANHRFVVIHRRDQITGRPT